VVLVEPATPYLDEQVEWMAWARSLLAQGRQLVGLFATHHHPDHIAGLTNFATELGLPLWAHPETAKRVGWADFVAIEDGFEFVLAGPEPLQVRALHTPGHAPGHLCLHIASQDVLLCGDMVAGVGTILIAPDDGDMTEYMNQLARLAAIGAHVALPAHGDPIADGQQRYREVLAHRLGRELHIMNCITELTARVPKEGASSSALVETAYADVGRELLSVAELSLRSHLIKLVRDGRVRQTGDAYALADVPRSEVLR
jgi:endoribonuclease LACTB2